MLNNSTTAATILKLQRNIERIISFLEPREFINCHMVSYICDDLWNKHIPAGIRSEIQKQEDVDSAIEVFFHQEDADPALIKKHQNLFDHIKMTKSFYLENLDDKLFITTDELFGEFTKMNIPHPSGINLSVKEFMKDKKNHEVEIIARVIAALTNARGKKHFVIDVGDGKGYLSSRLSLEFKLKVLGIDGNLSNTKEAEKRNQKLSKQWKALVSKEAKKKNIEVVNMDNDEALRNDLYKTTSKMIFANTDLKTLAAETFPDEDTSELCLVGLHTCGNLASNSLKQFVRNDEIKLVCNVGCCYHLLFEEFEDDFFNDEVREMDSLDEAGFPMSRFLREKNYRLGRNARMLAAQCFERVIDGKNLPDISLFYRALFEKILKERWCPDEPDKVVKLGKIRFNSLEEYLRKGCKKFNIDMDLTAEEIESLITTHEFDRRLINLNYFIRLLNAKVIETLILFDRYLYLLESDSVEKALLVKLFNPVISPRNYALIAIKK